MTDCIIREVFGETGLRVKVECYFLASIEEGCLSSDWKDIGGGVRYRCFLTLDEIRQKNVFPEFLSEGSWLKEGRIGKEIYQGLEVKK